VPPLEIVVFPPDKPEVPFAVAPVPPEPTVTVSSSNGDTAILL
jgi:hypothetical protein